MAIRFFADHCVASSIIAALRDAGHEVLLLRDHLPTDAADSDVIARAQRLDAILLSINGDFADIVSYPPRNYQGIVSLRVGTHPEIAVRVTARLVDYLALHRQADQYTGKLLIVEPHQIRIRGG